MQRLEGQRISISAMLLGPMGFLKKTNDFYNLFLERMLRTEIVVGSPGIVADASDDVINMAPVKCLI